MRKFSGEKRLNKIPKQYPALERHLRRPQASSRSPEGEETLRPPRSDLRSPGKISRLDELPRLRGKIQPEGERKNDMGRPSFGEQGSLFIFQSSFYTLSYA